MSANWTPSGPWMMKFRNALVPAFDPPSMQLLTAEYFGPARAFFNQTNINEPFEYRVYQLINQARMDDWLLDLVAAAHERRPKNKDIAKIAEELGLTAAGPRLLNQTGKSLEELIQTNAKFITPSLFREKLAELEGRVCWIKIPGGGGTGFLVGPDLVVTNHHVIQRVKAGLASWRDVVCVFDYREPLNPASTTGKKTVDVKLSSRAEGWLVDTNPPSDADEDPALGEAAAGETDCALIRLEDPVGDLPVGGFTGDAQAQPRRWIDAQAAVPPLAAGSQIFILQHPEQEPLRLTVGVVKQFNQSGTRVRYDANSKKGSSGSPCFDADLNLVALHHAHDPAEPPQWNQAVPFSWIQDSWHAKSISLT